MNGNKAYELQYENEIKKIINKTPELQGFYAYIGDKALSTVCNYLGHVSNFLRYIDKPVSQVNFDDFNGYLMTSRKSKNGETTTSSYRIVVYQALKKYSKYLVARGVLKTDPMDSIDRPKAVESQKTIEKREIGYLSKAEITKYINSVDIGVGSNMSKSFQKEWRERDKAIIIVFLNTGLRRAALMKLDVNSINFEDKNLIVTDKEGKVDTYSLSDEVLEILNAWLRKREKLLNGKHEDALFISNRRQRMNQRAIYDIVKKYASNIKGKNITPHKLRATYGTQLYEATKDIYFVQDCMHHANPQTTELYIRGNKNQTKKASDIMKNLTIK